MNGVRGVETHGDYVYISKGLLNGLYEQVQRFNLQVHLTSIKKAADRLVETQNEDGGWDWTNPDTDPATGVPSRVHTLGVTAQGVLDAYRLTENPAYLAACIKTYDGMAAQGPDWRIRGPDLPYLVELSEVTGEEDYADFALDKYKDALDKVGEGTAKGLAEWIVVIREPYPGLISWDIDHYLQGASALHRYFAEERYLNDAKAMAEVIYKAYFGDSPALDFEDDTQSYYWLAHTGAIQSFATTGIHPDKMHELKEALINSQGEKGCFLDGVYCDPQVTAYAVIALLKIAEKDSAAKGVDHLMTVQNGNGCWTYGTTEYTEVTSEAAQAIHDEAG